MKKLLVVLSLVSTPALAQNTPLQMGAEINTQLPSGKLGGITAQSLRQVLLDMLTAAPSILSSTSPLSSLTNPGGGDTTKTGIVVTNTDSSAQTGVERAAAQINLFGSGTGDGTVSGEASALKISAWDPNWPSNTIRGQRLGLLGYARCGYMGTPSAAYIAAYGYDPSGDCSGMNWNVYGSGGTGNFTTLMEARVGQATNGLFTAGNLLDMDIQMGSYQQGHNNGIGLLFTATGGPLDTAFAASNINAGSATPSTWTNFLKYSFDDGTNPAYDAFQVEQAGALALRGPGGVTNEKKLRVSGNVLQTLASTSAGAGVLETLDDSGNKGVSGNFIAPDNHAFVFGANSAYISGSSAGGYMLFNAAGEVMRIINGGVSIGTTTSAGSTNLLVAGSVNSIGVFKANGTPGVSCSGTPTSSFASVGGIVTHC